MTTWRCLVVSPAGQSDWRMVEAPSREAAVMRLVADGLTPIDLRSGKVGLWERLQQPVTFARGLGIADQALVLRQLATLARAGVPIDRSIDLLRDQASRTAPRKLLDAALIRVRGGGSLAAAFEDSGAFPRYVTGVIRAAERSGKLADALASVAERLEQAATTRRQLVTALAYPAAVLFATIAALVLVLTVIVPQFEPLFAGQEASLPMLTRLVLWLSRAVNDHGLLLLVLPAAVAVAIVTTLRNPRLRAAAATILHGWPVMALRDQNLASQFASLTGTLLINGLTVIDALPLVRDTLASQRWRLYLIRVERDIRGGRRLSTALAEGRLLAPTVIRLMEVGEQSGRLGETSLQAGHIMAETVRAKVDRIVALANPVAIIALGGLVGMLVAGVMLGIFAMGDFAQ